MLSLRRVCQADAKLITGKLNKYFTNEALTYFCINFILLSIMSFISLMVTQIQNSKWDQILQAVRTAVQCN